MRARARGPRPMDEFALIERYFAPLAKDPGAFGLKDDAAVVSVPKGMDLVITKDAIVAGIHFFEDDPPHRIAQKLARVNLSDLAAKGARPLGYFLAAAFHKPISLEWIASFAKGLKSDQVRFGWSLLGGDTVSTPGPATFSLTALGLVSKGKMIRRSGALPGDEVWVTGTIGDAGLGLQLRQGLAIGISGRDREHALGRYLMPGPRVAFGQHLAKFAHAAIDVSDGLLADGGHIGETSNVRLVLESQSIPMSPGVRAWTALQEGGSILALTAGDDYEIVFAAGPSARTRIEAVGRATATKVTRIGHVEKGRGLVLLGGHGEQLATPRRGFTHI